ncbi:hypothetical protein ACHAL6_05945 [Proteiniclasticum sp. C24MP]|uniref:hypothetical protein n=1 Tax=Proteiniclasticum sp. C24MP TaxID=3374101 RepID=UPI0037548FFB
MMQTNSLYKILGGAIGFLIGILAGGYIGLVLGGTFLGGFDIYESIGMEGYELTTYIGAFIGAVAFALWGIRIAMKLSSQKEK